MLGGLSAYTYKKKLEHILQTATSRLHFSYTVANNNFYRRAVFLHNILTPPTFYIDPFSDRALIRRNEKSLPR